MTQQSPQAKRSTVHTGRKLAAAPTLKGIGILVISLALEVAALALAWEYLFRSDDADYSRDAITISVHYDIGLADQSNPPRFTIGHTTEPSLEVFSLMAHDTIDPNATVEIALKKGTHPSSQWKCRSPEYHSDDYDGPDLIPLEGSLTFPFRNVPTVAIDPSDGSKSESTEVFWAPDVFCVRTGDGWLNHGQGLVSLAPARIYGNINGSERYRFQAKEKVVTPFSWEGQTDRAYESTFPDFPADTDITFTHDQGATSDSEWLQYSDLLFFIDRERQGDAERKAWVSALLAGLGAGLTPRGISRLRSSNGREPTLPCMRSVNSNSSGDGAEFGTIRRGVALLIVALVVAPAGKKFANAARRFRARN